MNNMMKSEEVLKKIINFEESENIDLTNLKNSFVKTHAVIVFKKDNSIRISNKINVIREFTKVMLEDYSCEEMCLRFENTRLIIEFLDNAHILLCRIELSGFEEFSYNTEFMFFLYTYDFYHIIKNFDNTDNCRIEIKDNLFNFKSVNGNFEYNCLLKEVNMSKVNVYENIGGIDVKDVDDSCVFEERDLYRILNFIDIEYINLFINKDSWIFKGCDMKIKVNKNNINEDNDFKLKFWKNGINKIFDKYSTTEWKMSVKKDSFLMFNTILFDDCNVSLFLAPIIEEEGR